MKKNSISSFLYIILGFTTIAASIIVGIILFSSGLFHITYVSRYALLLIGFIWGTSVFSILALIYGWKMAPERARALQSHQVLTIANETLTYLQEGLNYKSAETVAQIIYRDTEAEAVAILKGETILAFTGPGNITYRPGNKISKRKWRTKTSESNQVRIFDIHQPAHFPEMQDFFWTGIEVPLTIQGKTIGTLDFLYPSTSRVSESAIAVAKGLGQLLSTQIELSELDKQRDLAIQSKLKALRSQINPHFLFNALNTIAVLCRTDPQTARRLLIRFSDFFRDSLERQSQFTTLDEEVKYVNSYLALEQARFGSKLKVTKHINSKLRTAKIPTLVIQPLVENAIKHGMNKTNPLHLNLSVELEDNRLVISVEDNGKGIKPSKLASISSRNNGTGTTGVGLKNIRERLASLYGSEKLLEISSSPGKGTKVTLNIPYPGGRK
jgi:LytS/YehU family sensor histidine kinase